jgi:hypothetical protein
VEREWERGREGEEKEEVVEDEKNYEKYHDDAVKKWRTRASRKIRKKKREGAKGMSEWARGWGGAGAKEGRGERRKRGIAQRREKR